MLEIFIETKMESLTLKGELDWIDKNPDKYRSLAHAEDVKHNIRVNYELRKVETEAQQLRSSRRYGNMHQ